MKRLVQRSRRVHVSPGPLGPQHKGAIRIFVDSIDVTQVKRLHGAVVKAQEATAADEPTGSPQLRRVLLQNQVRSGSAAAEQCGQGGPVLAESRQQGKR